jgi:hypothetical protein
LRGRILKLFKEGLKIYLNSTKEVSVIGNILLINQEVFFYYWVVSLAVPVKYEIFHK